jgi:hypothetical protein
MLLSGANLNPYALRFCMYHLASVPFLTQIDTHTEHLRLKGSKHAACGCCSHVCKDMIKILTRSGKTTAIAFQFDNGVRCQIADTQSHGPGSWYMRQGCPAGGIHCLNCCPQLLDRHVGFTVWPVEAWQNDSQCSRSTLLNQAYCKTQGSALPQSDTCRHHQTARGCSSGHQLATTNPSLADMTSHHLCLYRSTCKGISCSIDSLLYRAAQS